MQNHILEEQSPQPHCYEDLRFHLFIIPGLSNLQSYILFIVFLIFFIYFTGGCGAMFEIMVETPDFKGLSMVKQHRMINEVNDYIFQFLTEVNTFLKYVHSVDGSLQGCRFPFVVGELHTVYYSV